MSVNVPITKRELLGKMKKIGGLLHDDEALLLYRFGKEARNGVIVEIGSFKGKSTICLANGSNDGQGVKVYAIDPHMGDLSYHEWEKHKNAAPSKQEFRKNIIESGIKDYVYPLYITSKEAFTKVKEPVEVLFIDGDHRYKSVLADYKNWSKKMVVGGVMAFHDSFSWEGVIETVDEHVFSDPNFVCVGFANSITYFEKVSKRDFSDNVRNVYWLAIRIVYTKIVFMHLPKWVIGPLKKVNGFLMRLFAG